MTVIILRFFILNFYFKNTIVSPGRREHESGLEVSGNGSRFGGGGVVKLFSPSFTETFCVSWTTRADVECAHPWDTTVTQRFASINLTKYLLLYFMIIIILGRGFSKFWLKLMFSIFVSHIQVLSSHEDETAANDNIPISPPNVEVVSDTK